LAPDRLGGLLTLRVQKKQTSTAYLSSWIACVSWTRNSGFE